jgi:4-hydroxy-tetrahydrodipicolinate synthase
MKKFSVQGSWPALVTPMTNDGDVNYESLRRLVNFHIENKSDGVLVLGQQAKLSSSAKKNEERSSIQLLKRLTEGSTSWLAWRLSQHVIP